MQLTEQQRLIRDSVRDFARAELAPGAAARDRDSSFPRKELRQMGALGLLGMLVPEQWGGAAADQVSYALAIEEIAAADGGCSTIVAVQNSVVCVPLVKFATPEQRDELLPGLVSGERIGAFALTEPQAGSDASNLRTRARREGGEYVINGVKQFITSGANADLVIVFAVTDQDAGKRGISAFLVPSDTPGLRVAHVEQKVGQRCSDTAQLAFENVRVPAGALLGSEGEGYRIALANLEGGRIGVGAQSVGMARAAYAAALDYAREREAFGQPIVGHQAVAFRLADMETRIDAARLMVLRAAQLREAGEPCLKECSMAKLFASEVAEQVCSDAIQIHGGAGYMNDYPVERIWRDVRVCQIYEGTSDVQRMVISRHLSAG